MGTNKAQFGSRLWTTWPCVFFSMRLGRARALVCSDACAFASESTSLCCALPCLAVRRFAAAVSRVSCACPAGFGSLQLVHSGLCGACQVRLLVSYTTLGSKVSPQFLCDAPRAYLHGLASRHYRLRTPDGVTVTTRVVSRFVDQFFDLTLSLTSRANRCAHQSREVWASIQA